MRRFLTTIVCVLCVLAAYAVSYGTTYRGSGHSGIIYTTSAARTNTIGSGGVMASAPMATMSSTSLYNGRGMVSDLSQITGIRTSASGILGGRTTPLYSPPGNPGCHCVDENGDGICDHCSQPYDVFDGCPNNPCWCPIEDGWPVWLFMIAMAVGYGVYKTRKTSTVQRRP